MVAELNINSIPVSENENILEKCVEDKTDEFSRSNLITHVFVQMCNCNSHPARAYQVT